MIADRNKTVALLLKESLTWGIPVIILVSFSFLALQQDLRTAVHTIVGVTAIITILLAVTLYAGEKVAVSWSPGVIMVMAAVLRLLFLFRPPELSDDIYRYLWDGLRILSGHNPYSIAPSQVQTDNEILAHLLKYINHPAMVTIYPPAAQITFAAGALFGRTVLGIKALLIIIDLATCFILLRILSRLKLPLWRCTLYAWHPLPVIEIAASGHIDGTGIFFFLLALLLWSDRSTENTAPVQEGTTSHTLSKKITSPLLTGFFFVFSVLVKFIPLIFLPGLLMILRKRGRTLFLIGFISGAAVLTFPFLPEMKNSFVTLNAYLQNWEFSGFAFRLLRNLTSSGHVARTLLALTFFLTATLLYWTLRPKEKADILLNLLKTLYFITVSFLLMTTTLYPWYVLYLVCLLPFAAGPAGIVLTWVVFLSYGVLIQYTLLGLWIEDDLTSAIILISPLLAFILATLAKKMSTSYPNHISSP